jgi:hypothetical protein
MAVTSNAANCQNVNGTDCPAYVGSSMKEVWPSRHTRFTPIGHYNGKRTLLLLSLIPFMLQAQVFRLH